MDRSAAYLAQARSDFKVFELLWGMDQSEYASCHALQHLQMATEKLAKSMLAVTKPDDPLMSHVAVREIWPILSRRDVASRLGYGSTYKIYKDRLDRCRVWFQKIEQLSPSVGTDSFTINKGPNVEYPWEARNAELHMVWHVPAAYEFEMTKNLRLNDGFHLLNLINQLLERLPIAALS